MNKQLVTKVSCLIALGVGIFINSQVLAAAGLAILATVAEWETA